MEVSESGGLRQAVLDRLAEMKERDHLPYTQEWIASRIQVHPTLLNKWLSGDRPIPDQRRSEIALVLGMPRDWLLPTERTEAAA